MSGFSVYDVQTGLFTGQQLSGSEEFLAANTPEGCALMAGGHDYLCRRVDVETMEVVPWQPPAPAPDAMRTWEWSEINERWLPVPTPAALAADARKRRDDLLARCDWVSARAFETGGSVPSEWSAYRQALRDLPDQPGFPTEVIWPEPPAA